MLCLQLHEDLIFVSFKVTVVLHSY